ncbi:MAG: acylphosphatase [Actinomycetota bacterium]
MEEAARARVTVTGRVQGVFFRAETRGEARRLDLGGWVRNRPDGTVEAVFEGERFLVEKAVEWARHGPPGASVESVDVRWEEPRGEVGFEVRY